MSDHARLRAFLTARLYEDEAAARAAICPCGGPVCTPETGWYGTRELTDRLGPNARAGAVTHVMTWSPARALEHVAAGRALVAAYDDAERLVVTADDPDGEACGALFGLALAAMFWALPYAAHPDYAAATGRARGEAA